MWAQSTPLRLKVSTELRIQSLIFDPVTGQAIAGGSELGEPTVSLMRPGFRKQDLQEVALLIPIIGRTNATVRTALGLGYQYNFVFTPGWEKLKLYTGTGLYVGYHRFNFGPFNGFDQFRRLTELSATFRVAPGLIYDFSERFFLQVEVPLDLIQLNLRRDVLTQQTFTVESPLMRSFPMKFGFGVKF